MPQWQGHVKRQRPQKRLRRHQSPRRTGQKKIAVTATAERLENARTSHGLERARAQTEKEAAPHTEEDPHGERGRIRIRGPKDRNDRARRKERKGRKAKAVRAEAIARAKEIRAEARAKARASTQQEMSKTLSVRLWTPPSGCGHRHPEGPRGS